MPRTGLESNLHPQILFPYIQFNIILTIYVYFSQTVSFAHVSSQKRYMYSSSLSDVLYTSSSNRSSFHRHSNIGQKHKLWIFFIREGSDILLLSQSISIRAFRHGNSSIWKAIRSNWRGILFLWEAYESFYLPHYICDAVRATETQLFQSRPCSWKEVFTSAKLSARVVLVSDCRQNTNCSIIRGPSTNLGKEIEFSHTYPCFHCVGNKIFYLLATFWDSIFNVGRHFKNSFLGRTVWQRQP